VQEKANRL